MTRIGAYNPDTPAYTSILVVLPIIMFGAVLYPSRKTAPKLHEKIKNIKKLYNVSSEYHLGIDKYLENLKDCNIKAELSYELMTVIVLRDLKRIRFLRALYAAAFSFIALFLSQLIRASDFAIL